MSMTRTTIARAFAVLFLFWASHARAQYQWTHGNAAEAQDKAAWEQVDHMPHGLHGFVKPGQATVVNLPLATDVETWKVFTRVRIRFYAAADVHVTRLELWDGGTKVSTKTGSWTGDRVLLLAPPLHYQVQHGLNVSVTVAAGSSGNQNLRAFVMHGGGALFELMEAYPLPE